MNDLSVLRVPYNQKNISSINENLKLPPYPSCSEDGNVSHETSFTILKKDKMMQGT